MNTRLHPVAFGLLCFFSVNSFSLHAQERTPQKAVPQVPDANTPDANTIIDALATNSNESSIASLIAQYAADQRTLGQRFRIPLDPFGQAYRSNMLKSWESKLAAIDFGILDRDNQIDWLLLDVDECILQNAQSLHAIRIEKGNRPQATRCAAVFIA